MNELKKFNNDINDNHETKRILNTWYYYHIVETDRSKGSFRPCSQWFPKCRGWTSAVSPAHFSYISSRYF